MKRAHRLRALDSVYDQLRSDDFDSREHALFQLALLLRRSHRDADNHAQPDYATDSLPRHLLRLRLTPDEKRGAGEQLTQVITKRPKSRATAIWTLGELEAEFALEAAVESIVKVGSQLESEAAVQACLALGGWLSADESALAPVDRAELRALLHGWAGRADGRLAKSAEDLLAQLSPP